MITEDYVSYEIAKLLKEKGFDRECQGYYEVPTKLSSQKDMKYRLDLTPHVFLVVEANDEFEAERIAEQEVNGDATLDVYFEVDDEGIEEINE